MCIWFSPHANKLLYSAVYFLVKVPFIEMLEPCLLRLGEAAASKLQDLRRWTRAGLEYAITQHEVKKEIFC